MNYKKYINLLKNNHCNDCMFMNYRSYDNSAYTKYLGKGFTACLSSIACFCETELKMTGKQIIKYIFKDMKLCNRNLITSRIINFISEKNKLEIE